MTKFCGDCREVKDTQDEIEECLENWHDLRRIEERDGDRIAPSDDMGHYTPCVWIDVGDYAVCSQCGAFNLDMDPDDAI